MQPLTLYDVAQATPQLSLSPWVWKVRLALNYKNIPFTTIWIELPDVESLAKEIGAPPTGTKPNSQPLYTLPIIHDPNTNQTISDSNTIIAYLDDKFPSPSLLIVPGCETLNKAFTDAVWSKFGPVWQFIVPASFRLLSPRSAEHRRPVFEKSYGVPPEEMLPDVENGDWEREWEKVKLGFGGMDAWFGGDDQKFIMGGNEPTMIDFQLAGILIWLRGTWGVESREWRDMASWQNGRWANVVKNVATWM